MKKMRMTEQNLEGYRIYLTEEEKSRGTIEKYLRDVRRFYEFLPEQKVIDREAVLSYKASLLPGYQISSANSMLIAVNSFLEYIGLQELKVKVYKFQRPLLADPSRELSKKEYLRLLETAESQGKLRLNLIIQTICSTGIRISELPCITWESVQSGKSVIRLKGKTRMIILPQKLRRKLADYCKQEQITSGPVFQTRTGHPIHRSNIWSDMKRLCRGAEIDETKVFPHNLRHLFARTYYRKNHDIVYLADILGHSSIETTRIYTSVSVQEHERVLEEIGLTV